MNVEKSIIVNQHSIFKSTIQTASGSVIGNLNLGNGYIYDNSGSILFNNNNLITNKTIECKDLNVLDGGNFNGIMSAKSGSSIGTLLFHDGEIIDSHKTYHSMIII